MLLSTSKTLESLNAAVRTQQPAVHTRLHQMTATVHVQPNGKLIRHKIIFLDLTITHASEQCGITFLNRAIYVVFTLQLLSIRLYTILRTIHLPNVGHAQLNIV